MFAGTRSVADASKRVRLTFGRGYGSFGRVRQLSYRLFFKPNCLHCLKIYLGLLRSEFEQLSDCRFHTFHTCFLCLGSALWICEFRE